MRELGEDWRPGTEPALSFTYCGRVLPLQGRGATWRKFAWRLRPCCRPPPPRSTCGSAGPPAATTPAHSGTVSGAWPPGPAPDPPPGSCSASAAPTGRIIILTFTDNLYSLILLTNSILIGATTGQDTRMPCWPAPTSPPTSSSSLSSPGRPSCCGVGPNTNLAPLPALETLRQSSQSSKRREGCN